MPGSLRLAASLALTVLVSACTTSDMTLPNGLPPPLRRLPDESCVDAVERAHKQDLKAFGADENMFVRPGLLADRENQWVSIYAKSPPLPIEYPVEFMLIAPQSAHGYETLAVGFAQPSDVHAALEFIGMEPGRPVLPARLWLWPKGERVFALCRWTFTDPEGGQTENLAWCESLVLNRETGKPFPRQGFPFVGSYMRTYPGEDKPSYSADVFGPCSIMSLYNDPGTVLDVPYRAHKGTVYGSQVWNPDHSFNTNELIEIILQPEYKGGRKRVMELVLTALPARNTNIPASSLRVDFTLETRHGDAITAGATLEDLTVIFGEMVENGHDPFVRLDFSPDLDLSTLCRFCPFITAIDTTGGIHLDPPPEAQFYYKAFAAPEAHRARARRWQYGHVAWELHLERDTDGGIVRRLYLVRPSGAAPPADAQPVRAEIVPHPDGELVAAPRFTAPDPSPVVEFDASAQELVELALSTEDQYGRPGPSVILCYAPEDMKYGELVEQAGFVLDTHPQVFVYLGGTGEGPAQ